MKNRPFLICALSCLIGNYSLANENICSALFVEKTQQDEVLYDTNICRGFATTFSSKDPISTVIVGDEEIIGVNVLSTNTIGVIALRQGKTNIHLIGEDGKILFVSNITVDLPIENSAAVHPNDGMKKNKIEETRPAVVSQPQNNLKSTRIVVNAGDAEILYDCVDNCTKLKR